MASEEEVHKEIAAKFAGKWKEVRCENVDDFFKEMGLNFFIRKMAAQARPETDITVDGGSITVEFKTPFKAEKLVFKLNEEIEVENQKGKFLAMTTYADGVLLIKQKPAEGNTNSKPMETERKINEAGELETVIYVGDVVCKRVFTKLS